MFRSIRAVFSVFRIKYLSAAYLLLLGFETLASACVIDTENNKSFIEIGKERLDVPALIKNCCELGRAKESFIACFSNGNQCVEVNSNTELSSLANCDSRSRV